MKLDNKLKWGGFLLVLVLLVTGITVWKKAEKKNPGFTRSAVAVDTYVVQRKDLIKKIPLVGQTVADAQIDIAAKYAGRVTQVAVVLGDKVTAGQVLVIQDTGDVELAMAQNRAALRQAEADATQTQASYQAAVDKASSAIDALAKQRDDLILTAPREGMIVYRQVEVGAYVTPGQKLLSLVDNSLLYVECQIPEQDAALLRPGLIVPVDVEALGKKYTAQIVFVSTAKDTGTQSYKVRLILTNPDALLKSGLFVRTAVDVLLRPQTLLVPDGAVQNKYGKYTVFVIDEQNRVTERPVELGLRTDAEVEIVSGLQDGDKVAASNLAKLRTGAVVTADEDNSGVPGTGAGPQG
mgnify:CR=1 FL=1